MNNLLFTRFNSAFMYKMVLFAILYIGVGNITNSLYAQPVSVEMKDYRMRSERTDSCLVALEETVLIVRLPTYGKKIARLEKIERNQKLSKKQRNRAKKQKDEQIRDLEKLKALVFTGLYEYYDFSDFLITNDTLWEDFLVGVNEGVFYNEKQEIDPSIRHTDSTYLVLRYGKTNYGKTNNQTGFIVADSEMRDLESPFPSFLKVIDTAKSLSGVFSSELNFYKEPSVLGEFSERLIIGVQGIPGREAKRKQRQIKQSKN